MIIGKYKSIALLTIVTSTFILSSFFLFGHNLRNIFVFVCLYLFLAFTLLILYLDGLRLVRGLDDLYRQLDYRISLSSKLKVFPAPALRGYAISPDALSEILLIVQKTKPSVIVELGSGVSTCYLAAFLKEAKIKGKVYSIEHDHFFLEKTREYIEANNLQDYVELIHAPLKELKIEDNNYLWYDINALKGIPEIDLLIIDGPPGDVCKNARYPALPVLHKKMKRGSIAVLDDLIRRDEKEIVEKWKVEFSNFEFETNYFVEKGLAVIFYR